jgi:hypothetical protein
MLREEVVDGWKSLHNDDLHNVYISPNIIRVMKSRNMRLAGHAARIGEVRIHTVLVRKPEKKRSLGT